MKKSKVYADLGQQNGFGPISMHIRRASPPALSSVCYSAKNISHIQVLVTNFFPIPLIKLKLVLQIHGGRLVIPTHVDQSNYLATNREQSIYTI